MRRLERLDQLLSLVTERILANKDPSMVYVGLEDLVTDDPDLQGWSAANESISTNTVFRRQDVLFGKLRPNLRKSVLAPFDGYCSTDILVLRPVAGVNPRYAAKVCRSSRVQTIAVRSAIGTRMPRTSWDAIRGARVLRADADAQEAIAEILDTVDEAIRQSVRVLEKVRRVRDGLVHDLLDRKSDGSPKSWPLLRIREVAAKTKGSTTIGPFGSNLLAADYRTHGSPVIFVRDAAQPDGFQWLSGVYVNERKKQELASHEVVSGDVLVTKMGEPPGIASLYPRWMKPGVITADLIRIRTDSAVALPEWLVTTINTEVFGKQVRALMGGVTRNKLTLRDVREMKVPVPSLEEQKAVLDVVSSCHARISVESEALGKLRRFRSGLTEDIFEGKVSVTWGEEV